MRRGENAKTIHQFLLDETGAAYASGDFERFVRCFAPSQTIGTFQRSVQLTHRNDVRVLFDSMRAHFQSIGLTELVRTSLQAEFDGPDCIKAMHMSYQFSGTTLIRDGFPAFSILRRQEDRWCVEHSDYAMAEDDACIALTSSLPDAKAAIPRGYLADRDEDADD